MENLLEVGKVARPHGVRGAVKVLCYIEIGLNNIKQVYVGSKLTAYNVKQVQALNNDAFILTLKEIATVEQADKLRNLSVYIKRDETEEFKDKLYLSDLLGKQVINEKGEKLGELVDYEDYGASVILTIRCGVVSYSIPYVDGIIDYSEQADAFVINEQTFKDMRV